MIAQTGLVSEGTFGLKPCTNHTLQHPFPDSEDLPLWLGYMIIMDYGRDPIIDLVGPDRADIFSFGPRHGLYSVFGTFLYLLSAFMSIIHLFLPTRYRILYVFGSLIFPISNSLLVVPITKSLARLAVYTAYSFGNGGVTSVIFWFATFGIITSVAPAAVWLHITCPWHFRMGLIRWGNAIAEVEWLWLDVQLHMLQRLLPEAACLNHGRLDFSL